MWLAMLPPFNKGDWGSVFYPPAPSLPKAEVRKDKNGELVSGGEGYRAKAAPNNARRAQLNICGA
jgi:hypothetical protein